MLGESLAKVSSPVERETDPGLGCEMMRRTITNKQVGQQSQADPSTTPACPSPTPHGALVVPACQPPAASRWRDWPGGELLVEREQVGVGVGEVDDLVSQGEV